MSKKSLNMWLVALITLLIAFVTFLLWKMTARKNTKSYLEELEGTKYQAYKPFIEAMAKHESGNYTNGLSREYNNIFSMKVPSQRPFERSGETRPFPEGIFSAYNSKEQALRDLMLWMNYTRMPDNLTTVDSFVQALRKRRYFEQDLAAYTKGVKRWM